MSTKDYWKNDSAGALTAKAVVSPTGHVVPKNYKTNDLRDGDIGLTVRLDRAKCAEMTAEQRIAAQNVATQLGVELNASVGTAQEDFGFKPGMVVECSSATKSLVGVIQRITEQGVTLFFFDQEWRYALTHRSLAVWSLVELPGFWGREGLVRFEAINTDRCLKEGKVTHPEDIVSWLLAKEARARQESENNPERHSRIFSTNWDEWHVWLRQLQCLRAPDRIYLDLITQMHTDEAAQNLVKYLSALESVESICRDSKLSPRLQAQDLEWAVQLGTEDADILIRAAVHGSKECAYTVSNRIHDVDVLYQLIAKKPEWFDGAGAMAPGWTEQILLLIRRLTGDAVDYVRFAKAAAGLDSGFHAEVVLGQIEDVMALCDIALHQRSRQCWVMVACKRIGQLGEEAMNSAVPILIKESNFSKRTDLLRAVCYGSWDQPALLVLAGRHKEYESIFSDRIKKIDASAVRRNIQSSSK